jgi:hypothetical protein
MWNFWIFFPATSYTPKFKKMKFSIWSFYDNSLYLYMKFLLFRTLHFHFDLSEGWCLLLFFVHYVVGYHNQCDWYDLVRPIAVAGWQLADVSRRTLLSLSFGVWRGLIAGRVQIMASSSSHFPLIVHMQ